MFFRNTMHTLTECAGEFNRVDRVHCMRAIRAAVDDASRSDGGSWGSFDS